MYLYMIDTSKWRHVLRKISFLYCKSNHRVKPASSFSLDITNVSLIIIYLLNMHETLCLPKTHPQRIDVRSLLGRGPWGLAAWVPGRLEEVQKQGEAAAWRLESKSWIGLTPNDFFLDRNGYKGPIIYSP